MQGQREKHIDIDRNLGLIQLSKFDFTSLDVGTVIFKYEIVKKQGVFKETFLAFSSV